MIKVAQQDRSLAVLYIAHCDYGFEPVERFVASYRRYPAGAAHRLIVAYKGFADETEAAPVRRVLDGIEHQSIEVPPDGMDIGTYLHLARIVTATHYCWFNTNAVILADDWLAKLAGAFADPRVGLAGATGSWQSLADRERLSRRGPPTPRWLSALRMNVRYLLALRRYPAFPNPHLRTTAILVPAAVLRRIGNRVIRSRWHALEFESGRRGLTRIVRQMGLQAVIVDRDGTVHPEPDWDKSGTFLQADQCKLLAADNRTAAYRDADAAGRTVLWSDAWRRH